MSFFVDIEFIHQVRIEQYTSYPIYNQGGDGKGFNPFEMIPNNYEDEFYRWISLEARYKLICTIAANGDLKETRRLYFEEDYADVFEHYTYLNCRGK